MTTDPSQMGAWVQAEGVAYRFQGPGAVQRGILMLCSQAQHGGLLWICTEIQLACLSIP